MDIRPIKNLMTSILEGAILDLESNYYTLSTDESSNYLTAQRNFEKVDRWFQDDSADYIFSFSNICENFGVDPSLLRNRIYSRL